MSGLVYQNCLIVLIFFMACFPQNLSNLPSNDLIVGAVTAEDGKLSQLRPTVSLVRYS